MGVLCDEQISDVLLSQGSGSLRIIAAGGVSAILSGGIHLVQRKKPS